MADTWEQASPCFDAVRRERAAVVTVTEDHLVAITPPPGGSAVWHPREINAVIELFRAAQVEALHRRGDFR